MQQTAGAPQENDGKRRRMSPDARRESILDAAQAVFLRMGWDAVTVADVVAEAGISKGGFYHHFPAKEDLFDGLVHRMIGQAMGAAQAGQNAAEGNALSRFNAFIVATNQWRLDRAPELQFITDVLLRPENELLFHRINAAACREALPVVRTMIEEGVAEGCFHVTDAMLTAEMILALGMGRRDVSQRAIALARGGELDRAIRLINDRMIAEGEMHDRLLGLPPGSIALADTEEFRLMLTQIAAA
ncbi:TetR/AcrR family transcriptional regulator [Mameliella alba]|nr:TetR/AcrR family transcriptional regulator [Antarctobacter heliothermus]MBY6144144.1 TetR/AcrR family transcriptional regulator [Mameliella alba]MCA0954193.1 TetR/AcrR family transcriptional regulator [Mameliella alba]